MRRAYWLVLRLYSREHRRQFEDEMLTVFMQAAEDRQGQLSRARFVIHELAGLLRGAAGELPERLALAPMVAGTALAAVLNGVLYAVLSRTLGATAAIVERTVAARLEPPVALILMVTVSVFWLLVVSLLSVRLLQRLR